MKDQVTLLIYTFPRSGSESTAFARISSSIERTWRCVGRLRTVIVASHRFAAADDFAAHHENVELQIEPTLVPGDIKTMSMDCIVRLYKRFTTDYVLVIQDDGFPVRNGLEAFLGKWDFIGAPMISDGWKRKVAFALGFGAYNGGFSLRTRRLCEFASQKWQSVFRHVVAVNSRWFAEDVYYTLVLKLLPSTWWRFRFPSERDAFRFSLDRLDGHVTLPPEVEPFGVHGKDSGCL